MSSRVMSDGNGPLLKTYRDTFWSPKKHSPVIGVRLSPRRVTSQPAGQGIANQDDLPYLANSRCPQFAHDWAIAKVAIPHVVSCDWIVALN